jgi:hypothetical protein
LAQLNVSVTPAGAIARLEKAVDAMERVEANIGVRQNPGKWQIMASFTGADRRQSLSQFKQSVAERWPRARVGPTVLHLGTQYECSGKNNIEVHARIAAARAAWVRMGNWWNRAAISIKTRCSVFVAMVRNTLLSAMDVRVLRHGEVQRLERAQMRWLRVLLLGGARGRSNQAVRAYLKCYTVESLLRVARLKMLRRLTLSGEAGSATLLALVGSSQARPASQLDVHGVPTADANPWLRQLWGDVVALAAVDTNVRATIAHACCGQAALLRPGFTVF